MPVDKFNKFCELVRERLRINYDFVIAFAGIDPGVGKSSLAIRTGMKIDENFNLENNIAYIPSFKIIEQQFMNYPKYSYYLIDEAVKVLYKLHWMDRLQQQLNEMYDLERKRNICTALCIPRFIDLNEHFRNYRVKVWVQLIARGRAVVYIRDSDKDAKDPWHVAENYEMKKNYWYKRGKRIADIDIDERIDIERKTVNYLMDFEFDPLPPDMEIRYLELLDIKKKEWDTIRKDEIDAEKEKRPGPMLAKKTTQLENLVVALANSGKTAFEIKEMAGIGSFSWIYDIFNKHGILEARTLKKLKPKE